MMEKWNADIETLAQVILFFADHNRVLLPAILFLIGWFADTQTVSSTRPNFNKY